MVGVGSSARQTQYCPQAALFAVRQLQAATVVSGGISNDRRQHHHSRPLCLVREDARARRQGRYPGRQVAVAERAPCVASGRSSGASQSGALQHRRNLSSGCAQSRLERWLSGIDSAKGYLRFGSTSAGVSEPPSPATFDSTAVPSEFTRYFFLRSASNVFTPCRCKRVSGRMSDRRPFGYCDPAQFDGGGRIAGIKWSVAAATGQASKLGPPLAQLSLPRPGFLERVLSQIGDQQCTPAR
jgi:hypothetical protein